MKQLLLSLLALVMLNGCIEYQEGFKINKDMSGEYMLRLGVSSSLAQMAASEDTTGKGLWADAADSINKTIKGVEALEAREYSENGMEYFEAAMKVPSFSIFDVSKNEIAVGTVSLTTNDDGTITFTRTIAGDTTADTSGSAADAAMMESMFGAMNWTFTVEVPGKISAISEGGALDPATGKISWKTPMTTISKKGAIMSVTYDPSKEPEIKVAVTEPKATSTAVPAAAIQSATELDVVGAWAKVEQKVTDRDTLKKLKKVQKRWVKLNKEAKKLGNEVYAGELAAVQLALLKGYLAE